MFEKKIYIPNLLHGWQHCLVHDFKNILIKKMVYRSLFVIHFCFLCWRFFKAACCFFFCFPLSESFFIPLVVTCNNFHGNCRWIIGCRVRSGNGIIGVLITSADYCWCWGFVQWIHCERSSKIYCVCGNYCRILFTGWTLGTLIWTLVRFLAQNEIKKNLI